MKIFQKLGVSERTLKGWCRGESAPDPFQLSVVLNEHPVEPGDTYECDYLLLGRRGSDPLSVEHYIKEIRGDIREISHKLEVVPIGLDGLASRLIIRMLRELREVRGGSTQRETFVAGVIMDHEILAIEPYSRHTRLATLTLDHGVGLGSGGNLRPGRFLSMIDESFLNDIKYTYVCHGAKAQWKRPDSDLASALFQKGAGGKVDEHLRFLVTDEALGAGFVIMELDRERLSHEQPTLATELEDDASEYVSTKLPDALGEIMPLSKNMRGGALIDATRLEAAFTAWEHLEQNAQLLKI